MKKPKLIFLDVESTGKDDPDRICEVAYKIQGDKEVVTELFKPPLDICFDAMAVNHITNKMVADKKPFYGSEMHKLLTKLFHDEKAILVAHNAQFDAKMLAKEGIKVENTICTMKAIRHWDVKDTIPKYNMQYLRYYLDLDGDEDNRAQAHNAEDDVIILEKLYDHMVKNTDMTIDEMLKITRDPFLLRKLVFGKHKNIPFKDIPRSYLLWLSKQQDLDEDLTFTLKHYIWPT